MPPIEEQVNISEETVDFGGISDEETALDSVTEDQGEETTEAEGQEQPAETQAEPAPKTPDESWEETARKMGWTPAETRQEEAPAEVPDVPEPAEEAFDIEGSIAKWRREAFERNEDEAWVAAMVGNDRAEFESAKIQNQIAMQSFEQTVPAYKQSWSESGLPEEAFPGYVEALRKMGPKGITSKEGQSLAIRLALGDHALRTLQAQRSQAQKTAQETAENAPTAARPGPTATTATGGNPALTVGQFSPEDRAFLREYQDRHNKGKALTGKQIQDLKGKGLIA